MTHCWVLSEEKRPGYVYRPFIRVKIRAGKSLETTNHAEDFLRVCGKNVETSWICFKSTNCSGR